MTGRDIRRPHLDALLVSFVILDSSVVDPESIVAAFEMPPGLVVEGFDVAEREGLVSHVQGSMYELTADGEKQLRKVLNRAPCGVPA